MKIIKFLFISIALIFNILSVNANGEFNNEVNKLDVYKVVDNVVKVVVYTSEPYSDKIVVNKKNDNKYVIFLPETENKVVAKPNLSNVSNLISDIEVKTQPYSSLPGKGYTKITFTAKKNLNIIPETQTLFKAKAPTIVKPTPKSYKNVPMASKQVPMAVPRRISQQIQVQPKSQPVENTAFSPSKTITSRKEVPNVISYQTAKKESVKSESRQVVRQEPQAVANISRKEPEKTYEEQKTDTFKDSVIPTTTTAVSNSEVEQNEAQAIDEMVSDAQANIQGSSVEAVKMDKDEIFIRKLLNFKNRVKNKVKRLMSKGFSLTFGITVVQLILLVVLISVLANFIKKLQSLQKQEPTPVIKRKLIQNDETYEQSFPSYSNMDVYKSNSTSFEENNTQGFKTTNLPVNTNYKNKINNLYSTGEDFYRPLSEIKEEEKMSIFDENDIDIEKTIFKNPLTPINEGEELSVFDEDEVYTVSAENSPFAETEEEDEPFFNLEKKHSQEEFFIFEEDDEDSVQEEYEDYDEYSEIVEEEEDSTEDLSYFKENFYDDEDDDDESEVENIEYDDVEEVEEEPQKEPPKNPLDELNVRVKHEIRTNKGFSIVEVGGIIALIGFINSQVFILKKFKEDVENEMQVRLNEQPDANTSIYIIKIGKYKTLVEVTDSKMRTLLDL